jgi:hypothetical protein
MAKLWRDYSLSITLAVLFIGSWIVQTVMGWYEFVAEQAEHGQTAEAFGPSGYVWRWGQATFENWQSEFLQLFTFVVLTTFLIHRHSAESRDGDDEMQAKLDDIQKQLKRLTAAEGKK